MGRIFLILILLLSFQVCIAKQVDINTAKIVGYNFCKTQGTQINLDALSLVYTETSDIQGNQVNDFFIFNTGSAGFVIVAADDNVIPVLAYSAESSFSSGYFPADVKWWLNNYTGQINEVILKQIPASVSITDQWKELNHALPAIAHKTTNTVLPLIKTAWNQSPNYNYLCPFDYSAGTNVLTGCVATAMAQVMRYWKWPVNGTGSNTYYAGSYGNLSADFGSTTYLWDSMPNLVNNNNPAVGTLMFQAGVSVDMNYGVGGSSAQVMNNGNTAINCTQNALPAYFGYKSSLTGLYKVSYTDSDWVHIIQHELDMKRPVIYAGYGDSGGHCFIADGYVSFDRFHFNWGWGGYANGYFIVERLNPSAATFNNNQSVVIGIEPDTMNATAVKEIVVTSSLSIYPNPAGAVVNIELAGQKATTVRILDALGRLVMERTPTSNNSIETLDVKNLGDGDYIIETLTSTGTISRKLVIAR